HMRASKRTLAAACVLVIASCLSACTPVEGGSDGPVFTICGTNTGRAVSVFGDGPVYIDASLHRPTKPVRAAAGTAPIHVRVSQDCSTGATVTVSSSAVIRVQNEIPAKDGAIEVAAIYPVSPGRSTLTALRRGARTITVIFTIEPRAGHSP